METKRELNDILINDDDLQKQNRTKKLMMLLAMALVFLSILIAVIFVITRDEDELDDREIASNNGLMPIGNSQNFVSVPLDDTSEEIDPFQQILDDIRNREQQGNTQVAQKTQTPPPPSQPTNPPATQPTKPTQNTQPVLPAKPAQPAQPVTPTQKEPQKPTQPAPTPKQQAPENKPTQPAQPVKNVANIFEDVSTPRMDTSKNGQVAEKGYYVQVGSFVNKPSAEFLKQINNYSYRVYAGTSNGRAITKYLIGPYNSRTEASRDLPNFKTIVSDPVHFEVK